MFADLASIRPRICPKTLGRHGLGVGSKSATTLSKINQFSGTRQKPTSSVYLTKDRLDPEPGRTPAAHSTGPLIAEPAK
jgi:hypothetical protein